MLLFQTRQALEGFGQICRNYFYGSIAAADPRRGSAVRLRRGPAALLQSRPAEHRLAISEVGGGGQQREPERLQPT